MINFKNNKIKNLYIKVHNIYEDYYYNETRKLLKFLYKKFNKDFIQYKLKIQNYFLIEYKFKGFKIELHYKKYNGKNFIIYWYNYHIQIYNNFELIYSILLKKFNKYIKDEYIFINKNLDKILLFNNPFVIDRINKNDIKYLYTIYFLMLKIAFDNKIIFPKSLIFPFFKLKFLNKIKYDKNTLSMINKFIRKKNYIKYFSIVNDNRNLIIYIILNRFKFLFNYIFNNFKYLKKRDFYDFSHNLSKFLKFIVYRKDVYNLNQDSIKQKILIIELRYKYNEKIHTYEYISNIIGVTKQRVEQVISKVRKYCMEFIIYFKNDFIKLFNKLDFYLLKSNENDYYLFYKYIKTIIVDFHLASKIDNLYNIKKIKEIINSNKEKFPYLLKEFNNILKNEGLEIISSSNLNKYTYLFNFLYFKNNYYIFLKNNENKIYKILFTFNDFLPDFNLIKEKAGIKSEKNLKDVLKYSTKVLSFKNKKYKFNWKYWNCINTSPYKYYYEIYNFKTKEKTKLYLNQFENIIKSSMINLNILNMPYFGFYKFVNDVLKKRLNSNLIYEYDYYTFCVELIKISNCFEFRQRERIALNDSINEFSYLQNSKYWIRRFFYELKGAATFKDLLEYLDRHYQLTEKKIINFSDEVIEDIGKKYNLSNLIIFISNNFNTKDIDINLISDNLKNSLEIKIKRNNINLNELNSELLWIKEYFNKKNII